MSELQNTDLLDVVIIGAGLSGIDAAYHLQTRCPAKRYVILEARAAIGGTWDLFRYPGIRSDSDMYTLGYRWRPWPHAKAIADGPAILDYVRDAAREHGIDQRIRFGQRVTRAQWSSADMCWTLQVERADTGETLQLRTRFIFGCTGYYRYSAGYSPELKGLSEFRGTVIHPQHWPEGETCAGKRVVVIGSGATAVTIVPSIAPVAAHVTMLQRSPTYMISMPAIDPIAEYLREHLPVAWQYAITRWKNVFLTWYFFQVSRRYPGWTGAQLLKAVREALGPGFDIEKDFTPRYNVWDQRVCLVPDGDLFEALRSKRADIETDEIDRITNSGVLLRSGKLLEADAIVMATGLELELLGGMELVIDGRVKQLSEAYGYRGCMFTGVPNLVSTFGYTNASWTLKADLTCEYVCRLLNTMDAEGYARCVPRAPTKPGRELPFVDLASGYVKRALARLPKQLDIAPYDAPQNYFVDLPRQRYGRVKDGVLEFTRAADASGVREVDASAAAGAGARGLATASTPTSAFK